MQYPVAIEKSKDGYTVFFPDVPGCVSAGNTVDVALKQGHEALELHFEGMLEDGEDIPAPSELDACVNDPEYKGLAWAVVDVDLTRYMGDAVKLNITLPRYLVTRIDAIVQRNPAYASRSNFLAQASVRQLTK